MQIITKKGTALLLVISVISVLLCGCENKVNENSMNENSETPDREAEQTIDFETYDFANASLKDVYKDQFLIGTIYTSNICVGRDRETVLRNFNVITPENIMKPSNTQKYEGKFTFTSCDSMMKFAESTNLTVCGHTLCWYQSTSDWMAPKGCDRDTAIEQLRTHINTLVSRYSGKMYSIDVVNEAIADGKSISANGDWRNALRKNQWYSAIGPDYIELAFQFAHEADPDLKLYYNDYNLDNPGKAKVVYAMVSDFRERGIPIDGIGMQGHYNASTKATAVDKTLTLFESIEGIEIAISELDVAVNGDTANGVSEEQLLKQAYTYAQLFSVFKQHSDRIVRVSFWGYKDSTSWISSKYPLIFDRMLVPKESYKAVMFPEQYIEYRDKLKTEQNNASAEEKN